MEVVIKEQAPPPVVVQQQPVVVHEKVVVEKVGVESCTVHLLLFCVCEKGGVMISQHLYTVMYN